jgi:hypothetical protein
MPIKALAPPEKMVAPFTKFEKIIKEEYYGANN